MSKLFGHQLEQLTCLLKIRPSGLRICGLCAQECLISLKCQTARAVENGSNVSGHTQDYGNAISSLQNLGLLPPTRLRTYMPKVCWTLKTSLFFQFSRFAYKGSSFTWSTLENARAWNGQSQNVTKFPQKTFLEARMLPNSRLSVGRYIIMCKRRPLLSLHTYWWQSYWLVGMNRYHLHHN